MLSKLRTDLNEIKAKHPTKNLIFSGDFNCTLFDDDSLHTSSKPRTENILREILAEHELEDVWRIARPGETGFTYGVTITEGDEVRTHRASRLDSV